MKKIIFVTLLHVVVKMESKDYAWFSDYVWLNYRCRAKSNDEETKTVSTYSNEKI